MWISLHFLSCIFELSGIVSALGTLIVELIKYIQTNKGYAENVFFLPCKTKGNFSSQELIFNSAATFPWVWVVLSNGYLQKQRSLAFKVSVSHLGCTLNERKMEVKRSCLSSAR